MGEVLVYFSPILGLGELISPAHRGTRAVLEASGVSKASISNRNIEIQIEISPVPSHNKPMSGNPILNITILRQILRRYYV